MTTPNSQTLIALDNIKRDLEEAQTCIEQCSFHFNNPEAPYATDGLIQTIDEAEIYITQALEEVEQTIYSLEFPNAV